MFKKKKVTKDSIVEPYVKLACAMKEFEDATGEVIERVKFADDENGYGYSLTRIRESDTDTEAYSNVTVSDVMIPVEESNQGFFNTTDTPVKSLPYKSIVDTLPICNADDSEIKYEEEELSYEMRDYLNEVRLHNNLVADYCADTVWSMIHGLLEYNTQMIAHNPVSREMCKIVNKN